ncbi:MAG: hypothetical protein WBD31_11910, partial [Rubripirellula sp.]
MRIEIADPALDAQYIRHARTETLKAVCIDPQSANVEPVPIATYLIAYDERTDQPIGMAESAMLQDVYGTYANSPYASVTDLDAYCPISEMAGMRTVFVEPEYRSSSALFLALTIGSAKLFYGRGARFGTASTRADDRYLNRLYQKMGGDRVGTFHGDSTSEPSSLFVIELQKLSQHRCMKRVMSS